MEDPPFHIMHTNRAAGGLDTSGPAAVLRQALFTKTHWLITSRIGRGGRIGQGGLTLVFFLVRELARAPISVRLYAFYTLKEVAQATNRLNGFLKGMNE